MKKEEYEHWREMALAVSRSFYDDGLTWRERRDKYITSIIDEYADDSDGPPPYLEIESYDYGGDPPVRESLNKWLHFEVCNDCGSLGVVRDCCGESPLCCTCYRIPDGDDGEPQVCPVCGIDATGYSHCHACVPSTTTQCMACGGSGHNEMFEYVEWCVEDGLAIAMGETIPILDTSTLQRIFPDGAPDWLAEKIERSKAL